MANPFQDQFLKAGLVNKKQVGKAKIELNKKRKEQRRGQGRTPPDPAADLDRQRRKEQVRQANAQQNLIAREKEIAAQIKQLAAGNRLPVARGDRDFHFSDANKIKKMSLPKEIVDRLSDGRLGIVKVDGKYEIVPAATAVKIRDRRPEALLVLNERRSLDPNDPYAEFPIPDDYEW
ncbi:MAG: DUF2058 domain-containing protein [Desulfurivibrionaceae bacterium]|nr:DUF2058 domain-containing protein [Desulfobulbales bacterium]MDT8335747.1 DUF2058 domain-containing protein [Desulfurivibrionaceae bacterium]